MVFRLFSNTTFQIQLQMECSCIFRWWFAFFCVSHGSSENAAAMFLKCSCNVPKMKLQPPKMQLQDSQNAPAAPVISQKASAMVPNMLCNALAMHLLGKGKKTRGSLSLMNLGMASQVNSPAATGCYYKTPKLQMLKKHACFDVSANQ